MRRLVATVLLTTLALLLLAGCGSDEPTSVSGSGYAYTAPSGWKDVTGDAGKIADALGAKGVKSTAEDIGANYDSIVVDLGGSGEFSTNFNVITGQRPPGMGSKAVARANARVFANPQQAAQFLPTGFKISYDGAPPKKTSLDGVPAYEIDYGAHYNGNDLRATQLYVVRDKTVYIATFTASADSFDQDSESLDAIVRSWKFE